MKNYISKSVFSLIFLIGLCLNVYSQDCKSSSEEQLNKKACYQKVVNRLGELIDYPDEAYFNDNEGRVIVRFSTDGSGNIQDIDIIGNPNKSMAKEVIHAVHLLQQDNMNYAIATNESYRIPIDFRLHD